MSSENGAVSAVPPRIDVRSVSKRYRLGETFSPQKTAAYVADRVRGRHDVVPDFYAVRDATFEVGPGECFTILGTNGSGKSTLARMIAGITVPSEGEILTRGRVLPMFHVKGGFQAELTTTENVTMFSSLLGLSRAERAAALPQIADFAGLDPEHMATPVKRLSTGQTVRAAFATSLSLPADVYLFDEVLNAADDSFKGRCVEEIEQIVRRGATVVFISHELDLVRAICTRGIWIEESELRMDAPIDELTDAYHAFTEERAAAV